MVYILKEFFHIEIMISDTDDSGVRRHAPQENFEMIGAILIRFSLKKVPLFIIKNNDYSYTPGYTLLP